MEQKETYWSHFADDFEERNYYVIGRSDVERILNKVSSLRNLKNVLELGCGNGTYSKQLVKNADTLLSTDFSDEMVEASKLRLRDYPKTKVEKANCFDLSYPDNSFDTVFMANLIHIIPNPHKALQECKRVLKKGGCLIVISYSQKGMKFHHKIGMVYRYLKTYGKPPPGGHNYGQKEARELIEKQGFSCAESELIGEKSKAFFIKCINN